MLSRLRVGPQTSVSRVAFHQLQDCLHFLLLSLPVVGGFPASTSCSHRDLWKLQLAVRCILRLSRPSMSHLGGGIGSTWQAMLEIARVYQFDCDEVLRFLQTLFVEAPVDNKPDLLVATTMVELARNEAQEALTILMSYITQHPYSSHALCHAYIGMISLSLWDTGFWQPLLARQEQDGKPRPGGFLLPAERGEGRETIGIKSEDEEQHYSYLTQERSSARAYRHEAMRSIERALHCAPGSILFARYLMQLRIGNSSPDGALRVVNDYCEQFPDDPAGYALYLEFADIVDPDKEYYDARVVTYHELDPVGPRQIALNAILSPLESALADDSTGTWGSQDSLRELAACGLRALVIRLDHGPDEAWTWKMLLACIRLSRLFNFDGRGKLEKELWKDRESWWPEFHFRWMRCGSSEAFRAERNTEQRLSGDIQVGGCENELSTENELRECQALCAHLAFPQLFSIDDVRRLFGPSATAAAARAYGLDCLLPSLITTTHNG